MCANNHTPLHTLLRLSLPGPVRWLGIEPPAQLTAGWVAASLSEVQPGDLLVLPAQDASQSVCRKAAQAGAAALLLVGAAQPACSPQGIPAAWAAEIEEVRQAQQLLLTILVNQRTALVERGVRIHTRLSHLAAEGGGLDGLARAMAEISGRGVVVQDKRLSVLAEYPSSTLAGIWSDVAAQIADPELLPESLQDRKQAGRSAGMVTQPLPGGLARLVAPIVVGEVARGYLSVIGISNELDALDQVVLEQGALVCAVEMARAKAVREAEKRLHGDLLTALLQESLAPRDARLWVQAMEVDPDQPYSALRFAWDSSQAQAAPGTALPSQRRLETLVNGEIARRGVKTILKPLGAEVVCFYPAAPEAGRPEQLLAFAQEVINQALQEYPQALMRCGVGAPASELSNWRVSFRQAGQALEMARRFDERKPLYYPDLSVYRLLLQLEHTPELLALRQEILGPLLELDNADELLRTLQAYFEHNGNVTQTAEALFIHRNTLLYRMERIAEITHLDLDQPETRLAVQLALHIQRMLKR